MKKTLSFLLAILLCFSALPMAVPSAYALAETGQCGDNITWSLDSSKGTLTLSGSGYMYDYEPSVELSPFAMNTKIKKVIISEGIKNVGCGMFYGCENLSSVSLPSTLKYISEYSFFRCLSLEGITLPENIIYVYDYAFSGCEALKSISFPNSVKEILADAFSDCYSLHTVSFGKGLEFIDENAFKWCKALTSVTFPASLEYIGIEAFCGCIKLKDVYIDKNVQAVSDRAFAHCVSLEKITVNPSNSNYCSKDDVLFQKNMEVLLQYPAGKTNTSYTIPSQVLLIDGCAFIGSFNLKNVNFNEKLQIIGERAFFYCAKLEKALLPDTVEEIGELAFGCCLRLGELHIPDSGLYIDCDAFSNCFSLTKLEFPESVTDVCDYAFFNCISIKDVYAYGKNTNFYVNSLCLADFELSSISLNDYIKEYEKLLRYNLLGMNEEAGALEEKLNENVSYHYDKHLRIGKIHCLKNSVAELYAEETDVSYESFNSSSGLIEGDDCECICHKGGISAFFFIFVRFFWKLFRMEQTCVCGEAHY